MGLIKLVNQWVYRHSRKPEHYKRVKNPPKTISEKIKRPQDARQQQYNNWCKRYGVYSGSYLPENPDTLTRKGWRETTNVKDKTKKHREFQRKSTSQMVRYDSKEFKKGRYEDEHYHWENAKSIKERRKLGETEKYIDRYGNVCAGGSEESHLAPKDKTYNFRR